ncbi:hypothetical protein WA556_002114 [Blastocystis sp. ATCC 50177/Nand II]
MSEKDSFDVIPTTDIYVRPSDSEIICNTNPYLKFVAEEQASPLHTFITGFYQPEKDMHIFFRLNYDELYRIAEYAKNWKILPYTGNPDEKGIIYWMGCLNESHTYLNPITHGLVRVLTSNDYHVNYSRNEAAVSRVLEYPSLRDKDCYFDPGCIIFYFPNHVIHPTGYTYRNGGGRGSVVRKWTLEAAKSLNGPWTLISNHPEDDTFFYDVTDGQNKENSFLAHCWPIDCNQSRKEFYSFFRLQSQHTHPNGRSHALYISGFELFGIVKWSHE